MNTVHPTAKISPDVIVWNYATVCEDVEIGPGSVVGSCAFIGAGTKIGKGVRIQHGVFIPKNTVIEDYVFIGPNTTLTDDKHPVAGKGYFPRPPVLKLGCSLGAGVTVLPGVVINDSALIGAGCVVTKDVPKFCTMVGNPSRIIE